MDSKTVEAEYAEQVAHLTKWGQPRGGVATGQARLRQILGEVWEAEQLHFFKENMLTSI